MPKKLLSAILCLGLGLCFAAGCSQSSPDTTPTTDTNDPQATVEIPAPSDTPSPTPMSQRGDYATKSSPLPFGELGTLDGITWNLPDVRPNLDRCKARGRCGNRIAGGEHGSA